MRRDAAEVFMAAVERINNQSGGRQLAVVTGASTGIGFYPVQDELSQEAEVEKLWREVEATGRPVDAIAINAGIGTAGEFADETDLRRELKIFDLNVRSTVHLAKLA